MVVCCHAILRIMILLPLLCSIQLCSTLPGYCQGDDSTRTASQRTEQAWLMNLVAAGGITAWGVINWDYFSRSPRATSEHWFGHNSAEGGVDKLGHLWSSYAISHGFAALYRHIGYPDPEANRYGALSALGVTGLMEVGDAFSADYGFSTEDMVANLAGAAVGWLMLEYPSWRNRVDLRWEYRPDLNHLEGDFITDYEHTKYLVAIKASGFKQVTQPWLRALELHVGYYTRHYDSYTERRTDRRQRYVYVGLGLNVGQLLRPLWDTRLFNYIQVPNTYLEWHDTH
jgi:hypothetical protein